MLAVGFAWVLAGLQFSSHAGLGYLGVVGGWVWAALFAHLTLAFPSGRLDGWPERAVVATAYFIATVGQVAWVLVADAATFRPANCDGCPGPLVTVASDPGLAQTLIAEQRAVTAVLTVGIGVLMALHWGRASAVQ